ncbi:hypothetical protein TREMEDRAFT_59120 [Tremella mesenterica DSM 1558]|uniref:uncharacterized protein n=1 Tax=Tremella mesenterica (strain ATCC 24925 / CBS 8224 / DSM 1558 / NBRC 9311 / NRRL Y-6157 / RJB 2259-6 / UBC 559-6) TaxID=578456 RepID=UPI0003F49B8C|nr:uncharacterized protein TREMEDRAFT_59120 [Tremella mesenterica DSM 1558]EIW72962.1 hypothetical protein TREMEDRAFT_59120 [Tremella mesenterica DSM 1558]
MSQPTAASGDTLPPLPKDHLSHPSDWVTGSDPATEKQKGFINVLEDQHRDLVPADGLDKENLGKSEACEIIDSLKNGQPVNITFTTGQSDKDGDDLIKTEAHRTNDEEGAEQAGDGEEEIVADQIDTKSSKRSMEEVVGEQDKRVEVGKEDGEEKGDVVMNVENGITTHEGEETHNNTATHKNGLSGNKRSDPHENDDGEERNHKKVKTSNLETKTHDDDPATNNTNHTSHETLEERAKKSNNGSHDEKNGTITEYMKPSSPSSQKQSQSVHSTSKPTNTNGEGNILHVENNGSNSNGIDKPDETVPGDGRHLDHPENWATGGEPPTGKQIGFLKVLEKQKGVHVEVEGLNKSEASEKIDELKNM